jgi:hypothetical protein
MRASVVTLVLVAVGAAACATTEPAGPEPETPPSSECEALARQAARRVDAVLAEHRHCVSDSDCVSVGHAAGCFDHCTTAMARGGTSALQSIQAEVDAHECRDFAAQGCRVEAPPCAAPATVACRHWICE